MERKGRDSMTSIEIANNIIDAIRNMVNGANTQDGNISIASVNEILDTVGAAVPDLLGEITPEMVAGPPSTYNDQNVLHTLSDIMGSNLELTRAAVHSPVQHRQLVQLCLQNDTLRKIPITELLAALNQELDKLH